MRKFTYWVAYCKNDSSCYNVRGKTKRQVMQRIKELGYGDKWREQYEDPKRTTVEFADTMDLIEMCLGEAHGYWESLAE